MAHFVPTTQLTPADELRRLIEESESQAVSLHGATPVQTQKLLADLDQLSILLPELERAGLDLRPEMGTWERVQGAVERHAANLLENLKPVGGLASLRQQLPHPPAPAQWWWFLDQAAQRRRRRKLITLAMTLVGLVVAFFILRWAYNLIVDPNSPQNQAYRLELDGQLLVNKGDLAGAISKYESALALIPNDTGVLIWLEILYEASQQPQRAASIDERLEQSGLTPTTKLVSQARVWLQLQQPQRALEQAQAAIAIDPNSSEAHMAAATAYQVLGRLSEAADSFNHAAELANAQGLSQLEGMARVQYAYVIQQLAVPQSSEQ